ncbi:DUF167 domain-containing protein [Massilia sp. S19_KUP03_FR1]|uniref:DUF167 domain-containing protein n=1 Tax=Massilia sp. S19_KUP03_FR1 TaxID=3025503 RepID=UPI002FCD9B33
MSKPWCSALAGGGVRIAVQIAPNAKRTEVLGVFDDALKIKLQAQPIEGKANEALVKYIAGALKVSRSSVVITHGHTNKRKLLEVDARSLAPEAVERLLLPQNL